MSIVDFECGVPEFVVALDSQVDMLLAAVVKPRFVPFDKSSVASITSKLLIKEKSMCCDPHQYASGHERRRPIIEQSFGERMALYKTESQTMVPRRAHNTRYFSKK